MYYSEAIQHLLQHAPKTITSKASHPDDKEAEEADYEEARFLCNKLATDTRLNDLQKQ